MNLKLGFYTKVFEKTILKRAFPTQKE